MNFVRTTMRPEAAADGGDGGVGEVDVDDGDDGADVGGGAHSDATLNCTPLPVIVACRRRTYS